MEVMLWEKALEIKVKNSVVCNGWLECFIKRHNIWFKIIWCESADVPVNEVNDCEDSLPSILTEYKLRDIYIVGQDRILF